MLVTGTPASYAIDCVNWPEAFPYRPDVRVEISHDGDTLSLHFFVEEQAVRACGDQDRCHTWEDSCVEFFFEPVACGPYFNLECTAAGKIWLFKGYDRHERVSLSDEQYASVLRVPSLGTKAFGLVEKPTAWDVRLEIPASVFGLESYAGLKARGNFYKCGDKLPERHFVSWAPIKTEKPDFHRPEYFGEIEFI